MAIAAIDSAPLQFVFGGGTALSRAHHLIRCMSEDTDVFPYSFVGAEDRLTKEELKALYAARRFDELPEAPTRPLGNEEYEAFLRSYSITSGHTSKQNCDGGRHYGSPNYNATPALQRIPCFRSFPARWRRGR